MPGPGQTRSRRPTIRDVAAAAGVATSTASLVFSGKGPVAPATAARVHRAAAELGYAGPDPRAASLRRGRAGAVGVLVEGRLMHAFRDPYAVVLLDGLSQELEALGAGLLLIPHPVEQPSRALETVSGLAVDAFVFAMCTPQDPALIDHLVARDIPIVSTSRTDARVHQVLLDEAGATAAAVRHLHGLGHRRLAHLSMPPSPGAVGGLLTAADLAQATYGVTRDRARGFGDAAGEEAPIIAASATDVAAGRAATALLLDSPEPPTAIVAQSDQLAAGAVLAARDRGLRVPEDLSVVGFDAVDLPWLGQRLTTIDQHAEARGRAVGRVVRQVVEGPVPDPPLRQTTPTALRIGDTTGPPPTR